MTTAYIDIACNLFDPAAVRLKQTGLDNDFKRQIHMDPKIRDGVPVRDYLRKMDRAGIEHSRLIAVRCGDFECSSLV